MDAWKTKHEKTGVATPVFVSSMFLFYHNVRVSSSFLTLFASHRCAYGDTLDSRMYIASIQSVVTFLEGLFFCCPVLVCAAGDHLYGGQYGKFCNTSCPCAFDFFAFADHCPAHPLVLEIKHQFRLRIFMSVAAQFRFGIYRSLFPCQCGNGHHRRISGTSGHRRLGTGAVFSLTGIT